MVQQEKSQSALHTKLPFWRRYRSTLILYFVLIALLPMTIIVWLSLSQTRSQARQQAFAQLESIAELKERQIEQQLDEVRLVLDSLRFVSGTWDNFRTLAELSSSLDPGTANREISQDLFLGRIGQRGDEAYLSRAGITEIFLVDIYGYIIASTDSLSLNRDVSLQPYFITDINETYIQSPYFDEDVDDLTSLMVEPIYADDNEKLGYLALRLDMQVLGELMLQSIRLGESGETYLVNSAGTLISPSIYGGYPIAESVLSSEGITRALEGQNASGLYTNYLDSPVTVMGVYRWLPALQVAMLAEVSETEALQSFIDVQNLATVIALIAAVIAVIVAIVVASRVSEPIQRLTDAASRLASGDLDYRVSLNSQNEIGVLANVFNDMADQLQSILHNLEARVAERTRDLKLVNDVSKQVTTVLDQSELLPQLVELTRSSFELSSVSVFLHNSDSKQLKLQAATGKSGQKMLESGKAFDLDHDAPGLVPQAGLTREIITVNDVNSDKRHFHNPYLPETQSELVIPMIVGDNLVGILDCQSSNKDHFLPDNIAVLTSLAEQLAIAIRNAQLYEQAQLATADAERANSVKSAFLASMSHELRTPLNAIINFSKFLRKGIPGPVNEEQEQLITSIAESGDHLLNLINDVLDMSKIESGSLKLYLEQDVDLADVIETAVKYTKPILEDKPVVIQQELPDVLPVLTADKKRLLQIFLNVLSNACKFTDEGSVTVKAVIEDHRILVSIIDTGDGIAPEDAKYVFTAFKQTDTGLRQGGGTGLGMPITQKLTEAHGGRIWFESEIGSGTNFFIEFPIEMERIVENV